MRYIPACVGSTPVRRIKGKVEFGLSPHAWGLHGAIRGVDIGPRFIPTCVGITFSQGDPGRAAAVHPHMRGVYGRSADCRHVENRFIPTCVGFTIVSSIALPSCYGSSPHAWGLPPAGFTTKITGRFIPTCVGFTYPIMHKYTWQTVHPHMRGVYAPPKISLASASGSSPHAWGLRGEVKDQFGLDAVHPHMRGVYVGLFDGNLRAVRFIPTCVGFTSGSEGNCRFPAVHPHMRGVYTKERSEFW